jgi:CheY-like chemotaxis protein
MSKARILVVEDEAIVALDIQNRLSMQGYDVVGIAATGEEAIAIASNTRPQLALMDIRLQGDVDGIETAQHLRTQFDIPII